MLNLKNAFRHQNKLKSLIDTLVMEISFTSNLLETTQLHKKNEAVPTKTDETTKVEKNLTTPVNDIVKVLNTLVKEKEQLTKAINVAKVGCGFDIDGELSMNIVKRRIASEYRKMCSIKETTKTVKGSDYTLNVEGNQVPYCYNIEQTSKPDFDQDGLRDTLKTLEDEADASSNKIDELQVEIQVDYTPIIGDNDTLDDVIKKITAK